MYQFLLPEFEKLNKQVPNIHYGGCCVFAEELYNFLVGMGKTPKIITMTRWADDLDAIITFKNEHHGIFDIKHTVILVDGFLIDNNGIYQTTHEVKHCNDNGYTCFELTLEELQWMNREVGGWNSSFNREQIKDIVEALKKLENNLVVTI